MSWEFCWTDSILFGGLARSLSVAESRFHDLSCGKFPIPVRLGAWGTGMKFTNFPDRCTTSSTGHSHYLLRREFFGFHGHMMQHCATEKRSIMLIFRIFCSSGQVLIGSGSFRIPSKIDHLCSSGSHIIVESVASTARRLNGAGQEKTRVRPT